MKKILNLLMIIITLTSCSNDDEAERITLEIGQFHEGGIIFYLDNSGEHGFVAAQNDQATYIPWACYETFYNIINEEVGSGKQNTTSIVASLEADDSCSPEIYAAKVCDDLILEGYSDWFLPSFEELNLMHENRSLIGNFSDWFYWSSSELEPQIEVHQIWTRVRFFGPDSSDTSVYNNAGKGNQHNVRAIREF